MRPRISQRRFKLYYGRFLSDRVAIGPVLDIFKFEGHLRASGSVRRLH